MKNIYYFLIALTLLFATLPSCKDGKIDKNKYGNCTDDKQNQNEEGTDCGGVCTPCSSCNDGVKNSSETGVDCGGVCTSCTPPCNLPAATVNYTIYPSASFSISGNDAVYSAYYDPNNSEIDIDFNGSTLIGMSIEFVDNFNPITYLSLNETMVFKTIDNSILYFTNNSNIKMTYYGNAFSGTASIDAGQLVFIKKITATSVSIVFCSIAGGSDRLSINATTL